MSEVQVKQWVREELKRILDTGLMYTEGTKPVTVTYTPPLVQASTKTETESRPPVHQGQIELAFGENAEKLHFEIKGDYHIIKPKAFLGSERFFEINKTIKSLGGEYISAGKESHWRVKR